jgi:hypothetical protein
MAPSSTRTGLFRGSYGSEGVSGKRKRKLFPKPVESVVGTSYGFEGELMKLHRGDTTAETRLREQTLTYPPEPEKTNKRHDD